MSREGILQVGIEVRPGCHAGVQILLQAVLYTCITAAIEFVEQEMFNAVQQRSAKTIPSTPSIAETYHCHVLAIHVVVQDLQCKNMSSQGHNTD